MDIDINRINHYFEWFKKKVFLDCISPNSQKRIVNRGQVFRCFFGTNIGSEQEKERPCVVIQNDNANMNSPNTIVAPITHTASHLDVVVPIVSKVDSVGNVILDGQVLLGNITTISKARLGDYITSLSKSEMESIDNAILKSLELYPIINKKDNVIADHKKYIDKLKEQRDIHLKEIVKLRKEIEELKSKRNIDE